MASGVSRPQPAAAADRRGRRVPAAAGRQIRGQRYGNIVPAYRRHHAVTHFIHSSLYEHAVTLFRLQLLREPGGDARALSRRVRELDGAGADVYAAVALSCAHHLLCCDDCFVVHMTDDAANMCAPLLLHHLLLQLQLCYHDDDDDYGLDK